MNYHIEVITLPVSDVDRAVSFYTDRAGFSLDVDYQPNSKFRVVQLTPPGSSCSVQFGVGLTDATPGSARVTYLVVTDIEAAQRQHLGHPGARIHPLMNTITRTSRS
jgi:catechol 2,3-dioxygenase-like lactoylglutathione lyase family enzyme